MRGRLTITKKFKHNVGGITVVPVTMFFSPDRCLGGLHGAADNGGTGLGGSPAPGDQRSGK